MSVFGSLKGYKTLLLPPSLHEMAGVRVNTYLAARRGHIRLYDSTSIHSMTDVDGIHVMIEKVFFALQESDLPPVFL